MRVNPAVVITVALVALGLSLLFGWPTHSAATVGAPELTETQSPPDTETPTVTPSSTLAPTPTTTSTPAPVTIVPIGNASPTATRIPSTSAKVFLPLVLRAEPPALEGARKILKINANPIGAGGTAYAYWSIPNFREGEFDRGDGKGYIGPIAGAMTVDVRNVITPQLIRLRWRDLSGQEFEDTLTLFVSGEVLTPAPTSTIFASDCNPANPDWRGNSTPAYSFCVRKDMEYVGGGGPVRYFNVNQDVTLTLEWNIYGINGIRFVIEPSGQQCGPSGTSAVNAATSGQGSFTFNVNQLAYGGYIIHLKVTRRDNVEVNYNEKFLCIGNGGNPGPVATLTPTPSSPFVPTPTRPNDDPPPTPIP